MLSHDGLQTWYRQLGCSQAARSLVDRIRSAGPARRVGGGRSNVAGRYPSRKMGATIQFESHRVELAAIYEMEHDPDVQEYWDQPCSIKLRYRTKTDRPVGALHTPDYFVIRKAAAGFEEWKTEEELDRLVQQNPRRFSRDETDHWRCPPGEVYAEQFGLYYRIRSSHEINWIFQRNAEFLEDYLRWDPGTIPSQVRETTLAHVSAEPGVPLEQLFERTRDHATRDQVYSLIALGIVYVDLYRAPLAEPASVQVFANCEADEVPAKVLAGTASHAMPSTFSPGGSLAWDGKLWKIANVGESVINLIGESDVVLEFPLPAFERLARQGKVQSAAEAGAESSDTALARLSMASPADLTVANHRYELVSRHFSGELPLVNDRVPRRTLTRWTANYRAAEACHGRGYIGLLPRKSQRGNRGAKLPEGTRKLLDEFIGLDYENSKQKSKRTVWAALKLACDTQGILAPSYKTFCNAIRRRSAFTAALKRQGHRAAYDLEPFYWQLELKTPRHGECPFAVAHIDHTELDVELVCSNTGRPLGRPWITLLTDGFSRRILAFDLTFDPPSYRSCMMAFRECVRRHSRLPRTLVMDGGPEFQSAYFESLLALYECTKKTRPAAKARFGSICERIFGTTNTQFIHNLEGNTQVTRNVRQVTKSVDPKKHAIWTLSELYRRLAEYFYEVYDSTEHSALGQTPRQAFEARLAGGSQRLHCLIPYNQSFLISTLPTTPKGTAKLLGSRGIKVNHLHYWNEAFRHPDLQQQRIPLRFDPFDAGTVHAFVRGCWLPCHSEYYSVLRGRSEQEIKLATREMQAVHRCHSRDFAVTAKRLAQFLQSVEGEEKVLMQRLRDRESASLRADAIVPALPPAGSASPDPGLPVSGSSPSQENPAVVVEYEDF